MTKEKIQESPKAPDNQKVRESIATYDVMCAPCPIPEDESDMIRERLRLAITGYTVRGFAAQFGLTESALRSYLKGPKLPGLDALRKIAAGAGVTIDWIVSGVEPRYTVDRARDNRSARRMDELRWQVAREALQRCRQASFLSVDGDDQEIVDFVRAFNEGLVLQDAALRTALPEITVTDVKAWAATAIAWKYRWMAELEPIRFDILKGVIAAVDASSRGSSATERAQRIVSAYKLAIDER